MGETAAADRHLPSKRKIESKPLVEMTHDHLLGIGRELLEERCRVGAGRLEEHLGRCTHALGGLCRQRLGLEGLGDVDEDLARTLTDGGVLAVGGQGISRRTSGRSGHLGGGATRKLGLELTW